MKKILFVFAVIFMSFTFLGCSNNAPQTTTSQAGTTQQGTTTPVPTTPTTTNPVTSVPTTTVTPTTGTPTTTNPTTTVTPTTGTVTTTNPTTTTPTTTEEPWVSDEKTTIYLAGDSTVKTYEDNQYIGGWGQFLDLFLDEEINVVNCAQGGRSSRSFINEGRLHNIEGCNYSFTQNGGKSIEDVIEPGDFLFIQFGHNDDDTKKESSYSTMYDRMVPLGEKDAQGNYPVTPANRVSTTHLPAEYIQNSTASDQQKALTEIAKYGETYYAYDSNGTYKWYLKQYIDFAREVGATPVLVTPVARVKLDSNNNLVSGPGLHGENFAYVEAVRQLAEEEDCLLIDLFAETKTFLETSTSTYANFLMALKPNDLTGTWPSGYDMTYNNTSLGYTGIEATHYNKYGAYLTAAKVAEQIITSNQNKEQHNGDEHFSFADYVLTTPRSYVDPSNLISKSKVAELEGLFSIVNPTNPNRQYKSASEVIEAINAACQGDVTVDNYLEYQEKCNAALDQYYALNIDDRKDVTNYSLLEEYLAKIEEVIASTRPTPTRTVIFNANELPTASITSSQTFDGFTIVGASGKAVDVKESPVNFEYNGTSYSLTKIISLGGSASFNASRYIEFSTDSACTITVVAKSSGTTARTLSLVDANNTSSSYATFEAGTSTSITSYEAQSAGTYRLGSTGSGIYVYQIIIEYF